MKRIAMLLGLSAALIVGCEREGPTASQQAPAATAAAAAVPTGFVLTAAPENAKDLADVKAGGLQDGDEVVVRAVVGGSEKPFVDNRAVVQVIDPSVRTCDKLPGDSCATPWDACCHLDEAREKGATVQVVDAEGRPITGTLQGVGGLAPLKEVVFKGKARMEGKALVIDASNVWVKG